jgi:hypothetical protein
VPGARTYAIRVETPYGPWALFADSTQFRLSGGLRHFFAPGLPSVWFSGFVQSANVVAVDVNFYNYNRSTHVGVASRTPAPSRRWISGWTWRGRR